MLKLTLAALKVFLIVCYIFTNVVTNINKSNYIEKCYHIVIEISNVLNKVGAVNYKVFVNPLNQLISYQ